MQVWNGGKGHIGAANIDIREGIRPPIVAIVCLFLCVEPHIVTTLGSSSSLSEPKFVLHDPSSAERSEAILFVSSRLSTTFRRRQCAIIQPCTSLQSTWSEVFGAPELHLLREVPSPSATVSLRHGCCLSESQRNGLNKRVIISRPPVVHRAFQVTSHASTGNCVR